VFVSTSATFSGFQSTVLCEPFPYTAGFGALQLFNVVPFPFSPLKETTASVSPGDVWYRLLWKGTSVLAAGPSLSVQLSSRVPTVLVFFFPQGDK